MKVYDELVARGLIAQTTDEEEIKELVNNGKAVFYIGFDPTADSLHVGHFMALCLMKRLQMAGNKPIALIGGGTAMIGDPSGRTDMRQMMTTETIAHNVECFKKQMSRFIDFSEGKALLVNNADWLLDLNYVDVLREVGPHFSVNNMLRAECYKQRMEKGLSFLEFNYMIMSLALIAEMFVSQVSADRMNEIYDTPAAEGSEAFKPKGHDIVFDHVGFAYDKKDVLQDVSFTAREGEITALVGPSGSGKSTCARLAARLWDVTRGSIQVGGVDISTVDPEVLLSDYSMVFQDVVLFDDTVMENIRLGKHGATDEEVLAAAKAANCDEFVRRLPKGYDTPIGENGAKLSGGERQRISIARALLKDAPIVLLDEATASLDVENETKVQGALSRLLAGKTVLVIAHRMRTVEAADKIVVLADGKVVEQGSPSELMEKGGLFRRMVALQRQSANWKLG